MEDRVKFYILIRTSLKFVPKGPTDNKSALIQVMACPQPGDKPLFEPMLTQFTNAALGGDELTFTNKSIYTTRASISNHEA